MSTSKLIVAAEVVKDNFPLWSEMQGDAQAQCGPRALVMTRDFILTCLSEFMTFDKLLKAIKKQLPLDAFILDCPHVFYPIMQFSEGVGGYRDKYMMIFASQEWSKVPEGEIIPQLEILLTSEKV